jgi:hypothetical protein
VRTGPDEFVSPPEGLAQRERLHMKPELANHLNRLRDTVAEMDRILALANAQTILAMSRSLVCFPL